LATKSNWGIENIKEIDGRQIALHMCSVSKKTGYAEAFRWIAQFLS
jgi:hypothetical protein